ncbi:alpha/beta fold hydrolase [Thermodesulfatator indicus]|uniref:alpha/beta fold hydrolase n=1 Tax=Thermodesulfatator indicus TaxID=171695 RepID=UPI00145F97F9|nr:alpha/beta hydrolase [Thermodesulfatator indicus]
MKRLSINQTKWEYLVLGNGRETVLFLHGMMGAYDVWWQQITALLDQYKIISLTYPTVDTLEGLSQGILAILQSEKVSRVKIVGTSMGGYLAQYLMLKYPEIISCVVLGNTFPPNDLLRRKILILLKVLPFLPQSLIIKLLKRNIVKKIYPASQYCDVTLNYLLEFLLKRINKKQIISRVKVIMENFELSDIKTLKIPIQIIESDNDPLVEEILRERLKSIYSSAQIYTFSSAGHFPYINRAEHYTNLLKKFF